MLPLAISNGEVIIVVVLVVAPIAAIAFAGAGSVYREIGKGAFAMDHDRPPPASDLGATMSRAAREAEVRQMLEAKAFRQIERGETLQSRADEVLTGFFRGKGKGDNQIIPKPEDVSIKGRAWASTVQIEVNPPLVARTRKEELRAHLGGAGAQVGRGSPERFAPPRRQP